MSTSIAKQEIMKARQPKVVDVETLNYITHADAVYQLVKKYPGMSRSELCTALVHNKSDMKEHSVDNALLHLKTNGFIKAEVGKGRDNPTVYSASEDTEYKPRAHKVARKIAPNDKKAHKSIRRMTRIKPGVGVVEQPSKQETLPLENLNGAQPKKEAPVQTSEESVQPQDANLKVSKPRPRKVGNFEFIQGMAALDPNSPHFGPTARELAKKVVDKNGSEFEPKAFMFLEFGERSEVLTVKQAYKLWQDLNAAFGK